MVTKDELLPYLDREHAFVKHKLFQFYLERFLMILGRSAGKLAFVDAFAGPWKSVTSDYSDTSFGRAVSVIQGCRSTLKEKFGASPRCRALFFERDSAAYAELEKYAAQVTDDGLSAVARNERFENSVDSVVGWIEPWEYTFLLVDPMGYDGLINPDVLAPLLRNSRTEFLINYMWHFVKLATGHAGELAHHENLEELFGKGFEPLLDLPSKEKEEALIRRYMQRLRDVSETRGNTRLRVLAFPVEYADKKGVKYYLVYVTHNAQGLITFAEEMGKAAKEQRAMKQIVHHNRRERKTQTSDLFADVAPAATEIDICLIDPWLEMLPVAGDEMVVDESAWADALERYECYPLDLQAGLGTLIKNGTLEVVGVGNRRRSRFVHPENAEVLRRLA